MERPFFNGLSIFHFKMFEFFGVLKCSRYFELYLHAKLDRQRRPSIGKVRVVLPSATFIDTKLGIPAFLQHFSPIIPIWSQIPAKVQEILPNCSLMTAKCSEKLQICRNFPNLF
ncbi:MAG: hypothetical protein K0R75_1048 [Paenibacillaceae bacterium]|jgi:hypothetical protein|nr:hypothetical protein [Paenibacillaceae bacterium]